jgi:hypothetical protein
LEHGLENPRDRIVVELNLVIPGPCRELCRALAPSHFLPPSLQTPNPNIFFKTKDFVIRLRTGRVSQHNKRKTTETNYTFFRASAGENMAAHYPAQWHINSIIVISKFITKTK